MGIILANVDYPENDHKYLTFNRKRKHNYLIMQLTFF